MGCQQNQIEISLIIPTFNSAKSILPTLESASRFLKGHQFEIIVVDDGSSDSTVSLLQGRACRVFLNKHLGVSHARNVGLDHAHGKYVMFCDADDLLVGQLPVISRSDIISYSQHCHNPGTFMGIESKRQMLASLFGFNQTSKDFPAYYGGPVSKLFRRDFLNKHGLRFDEQLSNSEDVLFNTQAIIAAKLITTVKQGIYLYQGHLESATHTFSSKLLDNHLLFINQMGRELQRIPKCDQLIQQILSLYLYQLVFRYFALIPNYRSEYRRWQRGVLNFRTARWSTDLQRWVERTTIRLINHFDIQAAVQFARLYLFIKHLKSHSVNDQLL